MRMTLCSAAFFLVSSTALQAQGPAPVQPLFASAEPLQIVLEADFSEITRDRSEDSEEGAGSATITVPGGPSMTTPVDIRTRGRYRLTRAVCAFPPLRLDFPTGDVEGTILEGQDRLKLVTHCKDDDKYEQNVLKEFITYRIFNEITDQSFQVRLARLTYVDTGSDGDPVTRWGFLIEDEDLMAQRLGGSILEVEGQLHPSRVRNGNAGTATVFQYMVGNTDFSFYEDHNVRLVEAGNTVIPVPYDFDWTGLVNASYARPDPALGIRSVRQRLFRGLCRPGLNYAEIYQLFDERRAAIEGVVTGLDGITASTAEEVLDYLNDFYETIGNEGRARDRIEEACRPI